MSAISLFGLPERGRRRARRVRPLVAATLACAIAMSAAPAGATDSYDPLRGLVGTVAADPLSDEGKFVTLWDARFRSGPAFQAYLDSDVVYDDGYNDRRPEEQARLVRALVAHWRDTDESFRDSVDWEPRDPEADPRAAEDDRPHVEQVLSLVNSIVFHKEAFKQSLRGRDEDTGEVGTPGRTGETERPVTPADPLGEQATNALDEVVRRAADVTDPLLGQPAQVLAPADAQLREAVPPQVVDRLPTSGDVAGVDLGTLGEQLARVTPKLPALDAPPADIVMPAIAARAAFEPENLVYGVCWAVGSGAQTCSSNIYVVGVLTQLPAQSALINVDNNLLTGQLGADLELSLTVDPVGTPGGLGATVVVKRHGTAALNAKGVVRYALPGSDKVVLVGFDGRTTTLQPQQSVGAVFENIAAMSASNMRIRGTVSHNGAAGVPTVALVTDVVSSVGSDALTATTSFVRAPATHTTRLVLQRSGSTSLVNVESGHNGPGLPDLHVQAVARFGTLRLDGSVKLTQVPATTTVTAVTDDSTRTTNVSYDSTSQLTRLEAAVAVTPDVAAAGNRMTAALDLQRLPTELTLALNDTHVTYNANSAVTASATTPWALQASFEELVGGTARRRAFLGLSNVPTSVQVTRAAGSPLFVLDTSAPVAKVRAAFFDTTLVLDGWLEITGLPTHVELRMPSAADSKVSWLSSAPTTKVEANVRYGAWTGGFTVTNVPMALSFVPRTNEIDVNASGGTPATLTAYITNTGTYVTSPYAGDNYATATYKKTSTPFWGSGSLTITQVTAAIHVQGIQRIRVTPGATTTFELKAGGGNPLYLLGRFQDAAGQRGYAEARLVNFPGVVTGSIGSTTQITANTNTELKAYVESGPAGTYPAMTAPHGVIFRRTSVGGTPLNRGALWLTGLPTSTKLAPGEITLTGLRPTQPTLVVDVALLDVAAAPTEAYASLTGIPVNVPHTIAFTWSTARSGTSYTTKVKGTTSGASFGALSVRVRYAQFGASLDTSALPSSMEVTISESEGTTQVGWNASAVVTSLVADLLARPSAGVPFAGRGTVTLSNIPSWFTISTGRGSAGTGPVMTYDSNNTASLSATVVADGSLKTSSAALNANLFFRLTNLAKTVTITPLGSGFQLGGSGRTTKIEARVSASASFEKNGSGVVPVRSWVRLPWEYAMKLSPVVKNLSIEVTNVAGFQVEPGVVSRLAGDYGTFRFAYDGFTLNVEARAKVRIEFRIAGSWYGFDVWNASLSTAFSINPNVRVYDEAWQNLFDRSYNVPCYRIRVVMDSRPRPIATTNLVSGINLTGTVGAWKNHWVTPVLFGWTWLSDIATGLSLYGTGFVNAWIDDDWTCW